MAETKQRPLGSVASYLKNVGKSIAYSTVDQIKTNNNTIGDFIETNEDLFKDTYNAVRNYRETIRSVSKKITDSKYYETAVDAKKALFEDLRTGSFYNKKREDDFNIKAMGSDFADMLNDDWGMDSYNDDDDKVSTDTKSVKTSDATATDINSIMENAVNSASGTMVRTASYIVDSANANTAAIMANTSSLITSAMKSVSGGLGMIYGEVSTISKIMNGPMQAHIQNSKTYYETTTKLMQESTAMLKELTEMQRNLYNRQRTQSSYKESAYSRVGGGGLPDLRAYGKEVLKNIKGTLPPEFDMIFGESMGSGSNMLYALIGSPLKFVPDMIAKLIIPATVSKAMKGFDETLDAVFSNLVAQFNKAADNWEDDSPFADMKKFFGKIFGLKINSKNSIDSAKYEKGAVPFDGVTRKAIVDVIPGYLRNIEAALTGKEARVYDYESGKWKSMKQIEKEYKDLRKNAIASGSYEMMDVVKEVAKELKFANEDALKAFHDSSTAMFEKIFDDGGAFRPGKRGFVENHAGDYGFYGIDGKEQFRALTAKMMKSPSIKTLARNTISAKEGLASRLQQYEDDGITPFLQLFNDSGVLKSGPGKSLAHSKNHAFNAITDNKGHNMFFYLQNILGELILSRTSDSGYSSGGRKRGKGPRGGRGPGISNVTDLISSDPSMAVDTENSRKAEQEERMEYLRSLGMTEEDVKKATEGYVDYDSFEDRTNAIKKKKEEEEKKKHGKKYFKDGESVLDGLLRANTMADKFRVIQQGFDKLTKKPAEMLAATLTKADKRVFDLLFGNLDIRDKEGVEAESITDYIVIKLKGTFEKLNTWIDNGLDALKKKLGIDNFGELFKKIADKTGITAKWDQYGRPIMDATKNKLKGAFRIGRNAVGDVYRGARGYATSAIQRGRDLRISELMAEQFGMNFDDHRETGFVEEEAALQRHLEKMSQENNAERYKRFTGENRPDVLSGSFAKGSKFVKKTGLYALSRGEMIIPSEMNPFYKGKTNKTRQISNENRLKQRHNSKVLGTYAKGTVGKHVGDASDYINTFIGNDTYNPIGKVGEAFRVAKQDVTDTASSGLTGLVLGGGATVLTGLAGGPILGAAMGIAHSIISRSQTFQNMLFGEIGENGERQDNGMISAKMQKLFKQYAPDMGKGALTGALAGLFTPFGPVGGIVIGSALGYAKNNDNLNNYLFGEMGEDGNRKGGLISKKMSDGVKKAIPRMGLGAAAGILLGPGGFLLNAAMGAGLGIFSTTDKFKNAMLGEEDENGERSGGIIGAVHDGFVAPLKEKAIQFGEELLDFGRRNIFEPMKNFLEPVAQSMKNTAGNFANFMKDSLDMVFEKAIGMPLGDLVRERIVKPITGFLGKAFKAVLAPAKFAISAPFKALGFIGNNMRTSQIKKGTANNMTAQQRLDWRSNHKMRFAFDDPSLKQDQMLSGMGLDMLQTLKDTTGEYLNGSGYSKDQRMGTAKTVGAAISKYFKENQRDGISLYDFWGYRNVKKVIDAVSEGDKNAATKYLNASGKKGALSKQEKNDILDIIGDHADEIKKYAENEKKGIKNKKDLMKSLSAQTGMNFKGRKDIRHLFSNVGTELEDRKLLSAADRDKQEDSMPDTVKKYATGIIEEIQRTNILLKQTNNIPLSNSEKALLDGDKSNGPISGGGKNTTVNMEDMVKTNITDGGHIMTYTDGVLGSDKDSKEGQQELDEDKKREEDAAEDQKETAEHTGNLFKRFFGDKKGRDKEGVIGKLGKAIGKAGGLLGKIALVGGGIALSGHLSEYWKTTIWPNLEEKVLPKLGSIIIGAKDPESGFLHGGLRGMLFGNKDPLGQVSGGLFPGLHNVLEPIGGGIQKIFNFLVSDGEDGMRHWFMNKAIPGVASWITRGWALAGENIIVPVVSGLIKSLPYVAKGVVLGVKELLFNYLPGNKAFGTNGDGNNELNSGMDAIVKEISSNEISTSRTKSDFASIFKSTSTKSTSKTAKFGGYFGSSSSSGSAVDSIKTAVDKENQKLNKNNPESFNNGEKKGLFGNVVRTNKVTFDKNGEVATGYTPEHESQTTASRIVGAAGRGFINGLAGVGAGGAIRAMGKAGFHPFKTVANAATGHVFKAAGGVVQGVVSATGGVVGKSNNAGMRVAQSISGAIADLLKKVGSSSFIGNVVKMLGGLIDANVLSDLFLKAAVKIEEKFGQTLVSKAASGGLLKVGSAVAGVTPLAIILAGGDFVSGFFNAYNIYGLPNGNVRSDGSFDTTPAYDLNIVQKAIAGLVRLLTNRFTLGLLPESLIMTFFIDILFPFIGFKTDNLQSARSKNFIEKVMNAWNKDHPNEPYDNMEDFNLRNNFVHKGWTTFKEAAVDGFKAVGDAIAGWFTGSTAGKKREEEATSRASTEVSRYWDTQKTDTAPVPTYGTSRANYTNDEIKMMRDGILKSEGRVSTNTMAGYGHVYQQDPNIANLKYGKNATIGEAGCGPVAATNLVNGLAGYGLDVESAAKYATRNGFTRPDGGTSLNYFNSILNSQGYANKQSTSPTEVYENLKRGNQAVLLGQDNLGPDGPYSSRMHYINARGLDRQGNIIVEDPDRPESARVYSPEHVLANMRGSVIAAPRRLAGHARSDSGRTLRYNSVAYSRYGYGPNASTLQPSNVMDVTKKIFNIIAQVESGARYGAVNPQDKGKSSNAMSVGKFQWRAGRAKNIIQKTCQALGEKKSKSLISDKLYNDAMGNMDWSNRTASGSEKTQLERFLDTPESHTVQDNQALEDIQGYVVLAINKKGLVDEGAIIYYADMYHNGPTVANSVYDKAKAAVGNPSKITAEILHKAAANNPTIGINSKYWSRREKVFAFAMNSAGISTDISLSTQFTAAGEQKTGNIFTALKDLGVKIVKKVFGEDVFNAFFGGDESVVSAGSLPADVQNALVDTMMSKKDQIAYSIGGPQDPDKGSASCASTVSWAYRKVLGPSIDPSFETNRMSATSSVQRQDDRFRTIFQSGIGQDGKGIGSYDPNVLQPGDLLYYRRSSSTSSSKPYHIDHTEMYIGNEQVIGHGGPDKGTRIRNLSDSGQGEDLVFARRYAGLASGETLNVPSNGTSYGDIGDLNSTEYRGFAMQSMRDAKVNQINRTISKNDQAIAKRTIMESKLDPGTTVTKKNAANGYTIKSPKSIADFYKPEFANFGRAVVGVVGSEISDRSLGDAAVYQAYLHNPGEYNDRVYRYLDGFSNGRGRSDSSYGKARAAAMSKYGVSNSNTGYSRTNYVKLASNNSYSSSGHTVSRPSGTRNGYAHPSSVTTVSGPNYAEFLKTIVEILYTISSNSEALTKILELLSNNFGIKVAAEDVSKAKTHSLNAKGQLDKLLRNAGGSSTGYGDTFMDKGTEYLISSMTKLARE